MSLENPYLDRIERWISMPEDRTDSPMGGLDALDKIREATDEGIHLYQWRSDLCKEYSWAIPNARAIEAIVSYGPVVEIGAGSGYWGWLIEQAGGDYLGYDRDPRRDPSGPTEWTHVEQGGPEMAAEHPDRTLMLCWPPYNDPMAKNTLDAYDGDRLVYVGEGRGGCTGDDAFHHEGLASWDAVERVDLPQWPGIHDRLGVFERQ